MNCQFADDVDRRRSYVTADLDWEAQLFAKPWRVHVTFFLRDVGMLNSRDAPG